MASHIFLEDLDSNPSQFRFSIYMAIREGISGQSSRGDTPGKEEDYLFACSLQGIKDRLVKANNKTSDAFLLTRTVRWNKFIKNHNQKIT